MAAVGSVRITHLLSGEPYFSVHILLLNMSHARSVDWRSSADSINCYKITLLLLQTVSLHRRLWPLLKPLQAPHRQASPSVWSCQTRPAYSRTTKSCSVHVVIFRLLRFFACESKSCEAWLFSFRHIFYYKARVKKYINMNISNTAPASPP